MSNEQSRLLARAGVILFAVSLINGFLAHVLPLKDQTLAAHIVGLLGSAFLIALAVLWPQLRLTRGGSRVGAGLALYGFWVGWLVNFLAAVTGSFGVFPFSVGVSQGNRVGDVLISAGLLTVALADFATAAIVFKGLSGSDRSAT